ncbi:CMP deaminase [Candidatus Liberibacter solanacearum]|uniref:tRNA-specific adenosine deaminase n=1 Tax=Candidatus Liberibacter solanacearum TaxID=556287 RepID=A0A095A1C3_9HYPH|nr:nucleoside deaminase [Candidatus Liberibacter solanacearum]KGB27861.1 CMP deaminase [Candidatus Liberibacter solanacearum]KJZ81106.1 CMP deaminase [Candidatus Liberibacter solanacearum]KJZ82308.1 tRNA-specific adenosine-34 deaminase [Candidatus Liberibacter solanacearum]KQC49288.1 CMP deaminase [Candidatus Liberibacter solanacearum]
MILKNNFMSLALEEALNASLRNEIPVGAVAVLNNKIIGRAGNRNRELKDVTAHAEILAIRMSCQTLSQETLPGVDLYVTLEPCTMCAAAISFARIRRLYYGTSNPKGGAIENGIAFYTLATCHHKPEIYSGIAEKRSKQIMQKFFKERRM